MRGPLTAVLALLAGAAAWASPAMAQEFGQGVNINVTAGQQFTRAVATFNSANVALGPSNFQGSIAWGDGSPASAGAIVQVGCPFPDRECYEVRGTHTYASAGTRTIETAITGPDAPDGVVVKSTATVNPAPAPAPAQLAAALVPKPQGGGLVLLDASPSTGPIAGYQFDLDGNGSYETKCGPSSTATAVYTQAGPQTVGLKLIGAGGSSTTTTQTLNLSAGAASSALGSVKAVGACGIKELAEAQTCPSTLRFGTVELVFHPNAPEGACFSFARLSAYQLLGSSFAGKGTVPAWRSPKDVWVQVNGLTLRPGKGGNHLAATASPLGMRIVGLEAGPSSPLQTPLKLGGAFSVALAGANVLQLSVESKAAPVNWDVAKAGTVQTLPGVGGYLYGLPLAKLDSPLKLSAQADARLNVQLDFPVKTLKQLFDKLGVTSGPIGLRTTNEGGLELASVSASFGDIPLGLLTIKNLTIAYSNQAGAHVWQGAMNAVILSEYKLDGKIRFVNGSLEGAEVFGTLPGLGVPLGCCIYLNGFGAGFDEYAIKGKAVFIVPPKVLEVDWLLRADTQIEFGYKDPWAVKADGTFYVVGIPFGDADLYVWPSGGWAQGSVDYDAGPFSVNVATQMFVGSKGWYGYLGGAGCFDWIDGACIGVAGAASTKAITACGKVTNYFGLGGYYKWSGSAGIYFECSTKKVQKVAGISQASGTRRFRVRPGLRHVLLRFRGAGGAPRVAVTAPGGRRFASPGGSGFRTDRRSFLWVREGRDTYLSVSRPPGGVWRVEEQPGSPRIASVGRAEPLPKRPVRARVRGRGHRRVLEYRVARVPGQRVTFFEVAGRGGPSQHIGRARGPRGRIRFAPAEGPAGARRIEALLESSGLPRGRVTVARYRAPGPLRPARPRPVARRSGEGLAIRWKRVNGARLYRVLVRSGDGRGRLLEVRRPRLRMAAVPPRAGALVRVRAVTRTGLQGGWGSARVRAAPPLRAPARIALTALVGRGLAARCTATADGRCELTLMRGRRMVGSGARAVRVNRSTALRLRLTRRGRGLVRAGDRLRLRALLPGERERSLPVRVLR